MLKDKNIKIFNYGLSVNNLWQYKKYSSDENIEIPLIKLNNVKITKKLMRFFPLEFCEKYKVVPIKKKKNIIVIAIIDAFVVSIPGFMENLDKIKKQTGCNIEVVLSSQEEIEKLIDESYHTHPN